MPLHGIGKRLPTRWRLCVTRVHHTPACEPDILGPIWRCILETSGACPALATVEKRTAYVLHTSCIRPAYVLNTSWLRRDAQTTGARSKSRPIGRKTVPNAGQKIITNRGGKQDSATTRLRAVRAEAASCARKWSRSKKVILSVEARRWHGWAGKRALWTNTARSGRAGGVLVKNCFCLQITALNAAEIPASTRSKRTAAEF